MLRTGAPALIAMVSVTTMHPPAANAAQGAVVYGTVYDSVSNAPFSDAQVALWNTTHRAVTDGAGRYRIAGVPPGSYQVSFFHPALAVLGSSAYARTVTVSSDSVRLNLASPSTVTIARATCQMEGHPPGGVVSGTVADAGSGMRLPGARVTASWTGGNTSGLTDGNGRYALCALPGGTNVALSANFLDRASRFRSLVVGDGVEADFTVETLVRSVVSGRLTDAASGDDLVDVLVRLEATSHTAVTDSEGRFSFADVLPGQHVLSSRHLAYGERADSIIVPQGSLLDLEIGLDDRPIELPPIRVEVESISVSERVSGGTTITREQVDRVRHLIRDVGDLLQTQHLPGVIVRRRADLTLCVGSTQGQARMMNDQGCVPMVIFVNGVRTSNSDLALRIPPEAIDRMTVYKPWEAGNLFGLGSGNGVLMIYTKGN